VIIGLVLLLLVVMVGTVGVQKMKWGSVNHSRADQIEKNDLGVEQFNKLQKEDWSELLNSKKKNKFCF
jgi:hypothetical protein